MTKAKMPPRSQASLLARPTPDPTMQQQEHRDNSPPLDASATDDGLSAAAGAAKKKKKKGKGKRADDDLVNGNLHPQSMSTSPFSATAQAQADLLATASDLYRRIEADPQGIPDDDAYWTSLPSHLRTFIRNALPIGQLPTSAQNDLDDPASRQASTQAMIAVAQQLAQAAHASQRHLQQHPQDGNISFQHKQSGAYPPFPFDPSVFADLALQTEQALPLHPHPNSTPNGVTAGYQYSNHANPPPTQPPGEPLPAPVVLVNEFDDEQGDFDDDYYSDDDMDHHEAATLDSRDGTWSNEMLNGAHPNGLVTKSQSAAAKKKNKKKKKKGGTDAAAATNPAAALQNPSPPASNPPPRMATNNPANFNSNANTPLPPRSAAQHAPPLPSSRAAGKQPMTFSTASGKAPANTRTTANGHTHSHGPMTNAIGKRPASTAASSHGHGSVNGAAGGAQAASRAWSSSSAEERERIKDFWLGLNEKERKGLIKIEKDGVLKKMKEQQKHGCSCAVCGRKRSSIEDELEVLYDAYYDELEQYASHQQKFVESGGQMPPPPGPGPFPGSVALDSQGAVIGGNALTKPATAKRPPHQHTHPPPSRTKTALPPEDDDQYEEDLEDDEYEDDYEYDEEDEEDEELDEPEVKPGHRRRADAGVARPNNKGSSDLFNFGSSLTVKGGILTVADDLLKNDGQKFLEMMEQLAERRAIREEEVQAELDNASEGEDLDDEDVEEEEEEAEEDALTDEQRMEEGRRMFQIFAARMFEQRVLQAYREKVAQERQLQLLRELEEEDMAEKEKEAKKAKENQKKKDKKRQAKQQKEEERLKLEQEKAAEEAAARAKVEKQREAELRKQEELRLRREAEKRQKEEERAKKEEEKRRRQEEERQRELDKERKKREKEDKAKMEKEARERELREAKEAKDLEAKAKEEEERKAREQREKQAKEEQDKDLAREKAEKARKEQQQQRQGSPEILAPISPAAAKSQNQSTPNSPSASLHVGASSPLSRKAESHSDLPPSPAQFRSAAAASAANAAPVNISNAHRGAGPPPRPVMPVQATPSPSTLPAPPQGLPARPNTLSHGPSASLTIPTGSSSLPRPPVQNQNASGTIGSPARQGTPTASGSSAAGKVTSPPPQATSHGLTTAGQSATGMTFTKSSNGNGNAPPSQPAPQATGRYPGMSFGAPGASTPTRSPPRSLPPNAFMAGSNGKGTFDSMLSSPPNVNAATAGVASMNMGVLSGSAAPAPSHMPIGPIGGGLPSSAAAGPVHNRTPSISNAGISDDYARQTIGGGLSRPISRPAPGPIGPIGRRRDPSHDDFAHGNSGTSNLFGSGGNLPERILGSSALGGDDELVEPQPRRTSHNTAPMSNPSSLFGSSTFGVSSPWTSSFAGAGNGPTNAGGSGPGNARTPSTPNPSMLHNALGTGLTSPTGLGGPPTPSGSSTFSSLHHSGAAPGLQGPLSAGADPWARAANGWDRARYAFEQPASQQQQQQPQSAAATYPQQHQPLGGSGLGSFGAQSQHPLRGMFGMPHQTSPHRHTTDRGL